MTHQQRHCRQLAALDQTAAVLTDQVRAIIAEQGPMAEFLALALDADLSGMREWDKRYGDQRWKMALDLMLVATSVALGRAVERLNEVPE